MTFQDKDYFVRREAAEMKLAAMTSDDTARAIHDQLAKGYRLKIEQWDERPEGREQTVWAS